MQLRPNLERVLAVLVLAGAMLAALTAGPAVASPSRLAAAKHRALLYWGKVPCGGHYSTRIADLPVGVLGTGAWSMTDGVYTSCVITLARSRFGTGTGAPFELYCQVFIHETGHLLRFHERGGPSNGDHSANPRNVMFPVESTLNLPAVCKRPFR